MPARTIAGGNPPATITFGDKAHCQFPQGRAADTLLGREQKAWLKQQLDGSTATWKIWGATNGTLDMRTDPQNLPPGLTKTDGPARLSLPWRRRSQRELSERAEIYDFVRDQRR